MDFRAWFATVLEILVVDDEACLRLIRSASSARGEGSVALLEGELSTAEALAYARALHDLGRRWEAEEVLRAVLMSELGASRPAGVDRVPLGEQVNRARPD